MKLKKINYIEAEKIKESIVNDDPITIVQTAYNLACERHNVAKSERKQIKKESKALRESGLFKNDETTSSISEIYKLSEYITCVDENHGKLLVEFNDKINKLTTQVEVLQREMNKCIKDGQRVSIEHKISANIAESEIRTIHKVMG